MSRCKLFAFVMIFAMGLFAHADEPQKPAPRKKPRAVITHTEIGVGYLAWNEDFKIHNGTDRVSGVASYGGPAIFVEHYWFLKRWQLGANLTVGSGKAAASASGAITYSDGNNRAWTAVMIEPFARYLINNYVLLGAGLLYRHVGVTWNTADPTITLDPTKTTVTGQFDFKVRLTGRWTLGQSYAPLGFGGKSQWFTNASYIF